MTAWRIAVCVSALAGSPVSAAAADLMKVVMPEPVLVGGIDMDAARNSALGRHLLSQIDWRAVEVVKTATGFDPRRDLREVVFASAEGPKPGRGILAARGVFDVPRILAHARTAGASVIRYEGVDVITGGGGRQGWLAFLDGSTVVAGDPEGVRAAVDRSAGRAASASSELAAKATALGSRHDAWMVLFGSPARWAGMAPEESMRGAMRGELMQSIEQTSAGVQFGAQTVVAGEVLMKSEKDASALLAVLRFFGGILGATFDARTPGAWDAIFNGMTTEVVGASLRFSATVPEAEMERLLRRSRSARTSRLAP